MDRLRRDRNLKKSDKLNALAELSKVKKGEKSRLAQVDVEEEDVYDEMNEHEYRQLVAQRRRRGDFVVNDDGAVDGYDDDGEEFWDAETLEDTNRHHNTKKKKRKKVGASSKKMDAFLARQDDLKFRQKKKEDMNKKKKEKKKKQEEEDNLFNAEEDIDMEAMLADLEADPMDEQNTKLLNEPSLFEQNVVNDHDDAEPICLDFGTAVISDEEDETYDIHMITGDKENTRKRPHDNSHMKDDDTPEKKPKYNHQKDDTINKKKKIEVDEMEDKKNEYDVLPPQLKPEDLGIKVDDDDDEEEEKTDDKNDIKKDNENLSGGNDWFAIQNQQQKNNDDDNDDDDNENDNNNMLFSASQLITSSQISLSSQDTPLQDGSILLYWFDAHEIAFKNSGVVYLFGKALTRSGKTVSCCVTVKNIERNIYLLPRSHKLKYARDEDSITDEPVEIMDVYNEFKEIAAKNGIKKWMSKPVIRKYAFEKMKDGVPQEAQYLKVVYSGEYPTLPKTLRGRTFSHAFGMGRSIIELFLLKRKLMGPCWLKIDNVTPNYHPVSWCKYEFIVESQKSIIVVPIDDAPPTPTLKTMSISVVTQRHPKKHHNEVMMVSALIHDNVSIDGPTTHPDKLRHFSVMRSVENRALPHDFKQILKAKRKQVQIIPNERALLSILLVKIHKEDPDILVGHGIQGFLLEVLLHRMQDLRVQNWSRVGRLKRKRFPQFGRGGSWSVVDQGACAGRLVCDTSVTSRELIREKNYTLTNLAQTQLKVKHVAIDSNNVINQYDSSPNLVNLISRNENDAYLSLGLMWKLEMLPLSKQLTSLAGNLWIRSLRAARAERVEFLLLHEFHNLKYIPPEKFTSKERKNKKREKLLSEKQKRQNDNNNNNNNDIEDIDDNKKKRKKPQYLGGLVLEPIPGFYDKFVVMLDFNSLYPSIIREFNLCFTTVNHAALPNQDEIPALPSTNNEPGILPTVLRRLIDRRSAVKKLLKTEKNVEKKSALNIRQLALKLVANSMYGCLGFESSRFYCKPIASLVTSQGRDILQRTKELAESLGYKVIYGDTDSIMIDSDSNDLKKAREIGGIIMKNVNKQFKVLELALDGIFKCMLLLRKKKYAALIINEQNGQITTKRETKGLDLVRRDWCDLSKDISSFVLDQILSGGPRDEVIEAIHDHLRSVSKNISDNQISMSKFIITKGLTKPLKEYGKAKGQPHVHVATYLVNHGKEVRVGDHIPYVICKGDKPMAERAYHPSVVLKAAGGLEIDTKWYLESQVLPPIARLCSPIEETNSQQLAACLGLHGGKYELKQSNEDENEVDIDDVAAFNTESLEDDEEKFKDCEHIKVECPFCKVAYQFPGVYNLKKDGICGLQCPTPKCKGIIGSSTSNITNTLDRCIRRHVRRYYEKWASCSEPLCNFRTRQRSLRGARCLVSGCRGRLIPEYTERQLFTQLLYLRNLFDVNRMDTLIEYENKKRVSSHQNTINRQISVSQTKHMKELYEYMDILLRESNYYYLPASIFMTAFHSS